VRETPEAIQRTTAESWEIRHPADVSPGRLVRAAVEHDAAVLDERGVLKRGERGLVTRVVTTDGAVVVKESWARGLRARLGPVLGRSRGYRSFTNGIELRARGFPAARPLGHLLRAHAGRIERELLVMEDLGETGMRLDAHVLGAHFRDELGREARRALLAGVADLVRRLHADGVYYGDLKATNVFVDVSRGATSPVLALVDYDRVAFGRPVGFRRRVKNLAQLSASVPSCIGRTDRLRFLLAASPTPAVEGEWKRHARAVLREVAGKNVVDLELFE
jgi:hypothetical protein